MNNQSGKQDDPVVQELSEIKSLLVLDLLTRGVKPNQIAKIMRIDAGAFSRAYPMRKILGKPSKKK